VGCVDEVCVFSLEETLELLLQSTQFRLQQLWIFKLRADVSQKGSKLFPGHN